MDVTQYDIYLNDYISYRPPNAIDGNERTDIDYCKCCSTTKKPPVGVRSWWQIDLGHQYLIGAIQVNGRVAGLLIKLIISRV